MSELHIKLNGYAVDFLGSAWLRRGVSVLLAAFLGLLMWSLVPSKTKTVPSAVSPATIVSRTDIGASAEKIATVHLFGQAAASMDAGPAVTAASIIVQGHLREHAERIAPNVPTGHKPSTKLAQSRLRLVK